LQAGRENLKYILGGGAEKPTLDKIISLVESIPDVLEIHCLCTEYVGPRLVVEIHVNCQSNLQLTRIHEIETEIIKKVKMLNDIDRVYVHIEPPNWDNDPLKSQFG